MKGVPGSRGHIDISSISTPAWPAHDRRRICDAYREGGMQGVMAEFRGERSKSAIQSAVRRFAQVSISSEPPREIDKAAVRARINAMPTYLIFMRLTELMLRKHDGTEIAA